MASIRSVLICSGLAISIATSVVAKEQGAIPVSVTIETFFAPTSDPPYAIEDAWMREMNATSAGSVVRITLYNLTLPSMKDALINAFRRGVDVRVLVDKAAICNRSSPNVLTRALFDEGISIRKYQNLLYPTDLLHDKFLIIDDNTLFTGSTNFTVQGTRYNHENTVLIKVVNGDAQFIRDFINQFDRMWNSDFDFSGHEFITWKPTPEDCVGP